MTRRSVSTYQEVRRELASDCCRAGHGRDGPGAFARTFAAARKVVVRNHLQPSRAGAVPNRPEMAALVRISGIGAQLFSRRSRRSRMRDRLLGHSDEQLPSALGGAERAKAASAKSERERAYVASLDTFYRDADRRDLKTRVAAYSEEMRKLHGAYPNDDEAAVFYALSLIAEGAMDGDKTYPRQKRAAAILNDVLARNPDHPGVTHYLIHSFDYPGLAQLALPAARRYAKIAPGSSHAQHMPSHIFTRLGLWDEAIKSNLAAEAAAKAHAAAMGMPGVWDQALHAMDYLTYAYLQTGQDDKALEVLAELKSIKQADPPSLTAAYAVTAIPARVLLEGRHWEQAAAFSLPPNLASLAALGNNKWAIANVHFAKAVGAARSGQLKPARAEISTLSSIEQQLTIPP